MISYFRIKQSQSPKVNEAIIKVMLDGKYVGNIFKVSNGGYQYFPKGSKTGGDVWTKLYDLKNDLEATNE